MCTVVAHVVCLGCLVVEPEISTVENNGNGCRSLFEEIAVVGSVDAAIDVVGYFAFLSM